MLDDYIYSHFVAVFQIVMAIVTIWAGFAFLRERSRLTWSLFISAILTGVAGCVAQVLIVGIYRRNWDDGTGGGSNLYDLLAVSSAASALGNLVFYIALLLYGLRRLNQARRVAELEAILQDHPGKAAQPGES